MSERVCVRERERERENKEQRSEKRYNRDRDALILMVGCTVDDEAHCTPVLLTVAIMNRSGPIRSAPPPLVYRSSSGKK